MVLLPFWVSYAIVGFPETFLPPPTIVLTFLKIISIMYLLRQGFRYST